MHQIINFNEMDFKLNVQTFDSNGEDVAPKPSEMSPSLLHYNNFYYDNTIIFYWLLD